MKALKAYIECTNAQGIIRGTLTFLWIRAMRRALDNKPDLHFRLK